MILNYIICAETNLPIKNQLIIDSDNNNYLEDFRNPENFNTLALIFKNITIDNDFLGLFMKNIQNFQATKYIMFLECDIANNESVLINFLEKTQSQSKISDLHFLECENYNIKTLQTARYLNITMQEKSLYCVDELAQFLVGQNNKNQK